MRGATLRCDALHGDPLRGDARVELLSRELPVIVRVPSLEGKPQGAYCIGDFG